MTWTPDDLRTVGFVARQLTRRPAGFEAPQVEYVCSVSDCIASSPDDWLERWLHNGLFLFDTLATLEQVIPAARAGEFVRYGLRTLPVAFDATDERPLDLSEVHPEPIPSAFVRLGFDACSRFAGSELECSPLSCNLMAAECGANRWCLFDRFDDALRWVEEFARTEPEPGPYLLMEVWAQAWPDRLDAAVRQAAAGP